MSGFQYSQSSPQVHAGGGAGHGVALGANVSTRKVPNTPDVTDSQSSNPISNSHTLTQRSYEKSKVIEVTFSFHGNELVAQTSRHDFKMKVFLSSDRSEMQQSMPGSTKGNLQCPYPSLPFTRELELDEALWKSLVLTQQMIQSTHHGLYENREVRTNQTVGKQVSQHKTERQLCSKQPAGPKEQDLVFTSLWTRTGFPKHSFWVEISVMTHLTDTEDLTVWLLHLSQQRKRRNSTLGDLDFPRAKIQGLILFIGHFSYLPAITSFIAVNLEELELSGRKLDVPGR